MQELENIFIFRLTPLEAIINLLAALVCGIAISFFYRLNFRGVSYSSSYIISVIMLCMITALVIMVIGNNLARAFGLVGAMSIIRFRTAIKDTQDIMYIFFALAAGLACGAGMYLIAVTGTFFIGLALVIVSMVVAENPIKREFLLQILVLEETQLDREIADAIDKLCTKSKLINVKTLSMQNENLLELSYYVRFRNNEKSGRLVTELKKLHGVKRVNLFYDET
jgi:uncharacterized membrane protein YhiD involved in acid resistance